MSILGLYMEIQKLAVREQIVKTVVKSGNGGAVWVPKDWMWKEVVVILPERPKLNLKERIVHLLEPYLKDVICVGIYGSYARNEQEKESDVDVLVVTKDKDIRLDFKSEGLDTISLPIDKLKKAIEKYPIYYYQIVQEARPLINSFILEELKNAEIHRKNFKGYLKETREHIKSSRELLELDRLDYSYLKSYSAVYSVFLRLKGLFIAKCILNKNIFSSQKFRKWVIGKGLSIAEFEDCYKAYRLVRDGKNANKPKIKIDVAEKALNILEKELKILEARIYGKQEKKA